MHKTYNLSPLKQHSSDDHAPIRFRRFDQFLFSIKGNRLGLFPDY